MVVLAAAITSKNGKALLSRQFLELSKARIEGILAAFPKLMNTEKQHTFVETENLRYVYQPLESLYVLLITNKSSNILEDLETLHLLAKIVPEYCHILEEQQVIKYCFDLIFAFDETIAATMGYKERVNVQQIKHFTLMESNDEIRFKAEQKAKMLQAKKEADRQRKAIEKKRLEEKKFGVSISYDSEPSSASSSMRTSSARTVVESPKRETSKYESSRPSKGLKLGKSKGSGGYSQVLKEEEVEDLSEQKPGQETTQLTTTSTLRNKVHITISEKIALISENDGGLKNMEIKGELIVSVFDAQYGRLLVLLKQEDNRDFQFKAHPNMDKNLYQKDSVLSLKDTKKSYPLNTPSSVLKWRFVSKEDNAIPLSISVWPSSSGSQTTVPVEYEKKCPFDLSDVDIAIPISGGIPIVGEIIGSTEFDAKKGILHWRIPLIDESNVSGSMEFTLGNSPGNSFFPVQVNFKSNHTFCSIQIVDICADDGKRSPIPFSQETILSVEQYDIEG